MAWVKTDFTTSTTSIWSGALRRLRLGMRALLVACFVVLVPVAVPAAMAAERETVCVRQLGLRGWDRPSAHEATVARGLTLNRATKSERYEPLATYVVIFGENDRVRVLELELPRLMRVEQAATDEYGRQWKVSNARSCV